MFYPKSKEKTLNTELFKNPTSEYRAAPFWAWNCDMTLDLLKKEIEYMKDMGFGGFHMHPRVGLSTPYLSDEFMDLVKGCVDKAKEEDMRAYLYDEDKWPSGFAGGFNTKKVENRQKTLRITPVPYLDDSISLEEDKTIAEKKLPGAKYYLLSCYDVELDSEKKIVRYSKIDPKTKARGIKLFAYVEYAVPTSWYNGQTYVDTLKPSAIKDFIKITHERYKDKIGDEFGKTVPSIFSDEPQMTNKTFLSSPDDKSSVLLPYTTDFDKTFKKTFGYSFTDKLPEMVYELSDGRLSQARYQLHDHLAERFASAFADTIGKWCKKNGIDFTAHMMMEPALQWQTVATGETMRSYRSFSIPGIDMLADHHELSTAKQCQSASRQYGREGMMSELYGVTNWYFDFKGHKQQGDWQAAFGVTFRVPHLYWVSMRGEAKRDYPASIGYQSPWFREYKYIEDHFARVNTVMTRGKPVVNIGVIHPIESYWLKFGPMSQTRDERNELQRKFYEIINWLVFSSLDFDLISESLLPSLHKTSDNKFVVGKEKYDVVIVPNLITIRSTTLKYLEEFASNGGKVIFMGDVPSHVDALPSEKAVKLSKKCNRIDWNKKDMLYLLEPSREVLLADLSGEYASNLVYNMRKDGKYRHLFVAHVTEPKDYDVSPIESYNITIKGEWKLTLFDTITGEIKPLVADYTDGNTTFRWICGRCDSILIEMEKGRRRSGFSFEEKSYSKTELLDSSAEFTLSEPNVLLLDFPAYSINGGDYTEPQYVLSADSDIREALGIKQRTSGMVQPWVHKEANEKKEKVTIRFEIRSEIDCKAQLALESLNDSHVSLNGIKADMTPKGYYVDEEAIKVIDLPEIKKGINVLTIDLDFGYSTQLEAYYLLGDFGVSCIGRDICITKKPDRLYFDDIAKQGLPFYGGNISYHFKYEGEGNKTLQIQRFSGTAISVDTDGKRVSGMLAFPPNRLCLGKLKKGVHDITITLYGNRMNTFGQLHNTILKPSYTDPGMWRPKGRFYTPEYMLRSYGIFTTPMILS
ncbi:MAG: hypothetical protein K6F14_00770 [Clostridiales bacterium]|nr:hypothetical protein [Clostridiales bacterium]